MLAKTQTAVAAPKPTTDPGPSRRRPGRPGKSNVTGHFAPTVRRQLRRLAGESDRSIPLIGVVLNDLLGKHGLPEVVETE